MANRIETSLKRWLSAISALGQWVPRRGSLGWWLGGIQVLLVLLVAAGVSWAAIGVLQDLADSRQRGEVQLAGADARAAITRAGEDALALARVLSDRPTLLRLLRERDLDAMPPFLARFCTRAEVDACAVIEHGVLLAEAGLPAPWDALRAAAAEQGERFMAAPQGQAYAWLGADVAIGADAPGTQVIVARRMDERFAASLTRHEGVRLRLRNYREFQSSPEDEFSALHTEALVDGNYAVTHLPALKLYAASHPVFSSTGEGIALLETRLSTDAVEREVAALRTRLLWVAALLAATALLAGLVLGRRVTEPTEALTAAAARLGQGDFAAAIPRGGPAEIGQLARTMDEMRRSLIDLTGTLRAREAEAKAVLDGIVEGVYAVDGERRIRYLNDRAAKLLGIDASEAVGRFCGDVLNPRPVGKELPCERLCPIRHARQGGDGHAIEYLATPAGVRRMALTSSKPVDGLQVQVLRDETELEAVRRARDTVLANVSHEFRTPLAAQLASIELLREGLKSRNPAELESLVLSLERGTVRLTQLIDNLLESVRIEAGQLDIRHQDVDLASVIEDALATVEPLLRQRGQDVLREVEEDLTLQGDAVRLTQVLVNLLANASKYAPENTPIRVGAAREEGRIVAWVEDEGPGPPEGALESVFERFNRGGVEPAPSGMGLGLSISRSIAERHGGKLTAMRTADSRTRFTLTLPAGNE
ncbi:MAG: ATP-binding protein [Pseudomonadota bacterium]|jgi:signal transduction histidine kinase